MKAPLALSVALAAVSFLSSPLAAQDKKDADTTVNITGCLSQGTKAKDFMIKDQAGKSYDLRGTPGVDLKAHVGHKVMITGTAMRSSKNKVKTGSPEEAERVQVSNLSMVSATCQ